MFADRLGPAGVVLRCPDLNEPDFEALTITRMVNALEADIAGLPPGPVALIGSSLGGFVAFFLAVRQGQRLREGQRPKQPIDRLVLLAPALEFGRSTYGSVDAAAVERWRRSGRLDVFHYGENRPRFVRFDLYEDAQRYDAVREHMPVPTLVFQGTRDEAVDAAMVQRFCARQPHMSLRTLDDDHLLMGNIETILHETSEFLGARR
jgi:pimeloyl-ACP methyl ester carboxylesterase